MTVRAHLGAGRPASVSLVRSGIGAVAIAAALAALYKHVLRKPILNWGATDEEASGGMPGRARVGGVAANARGRAPGARRRRFDAGDRDRRTAGGRLAVAGADGPVSA